MNLAQANQGQRLSIVSIPDEIVRAQAIRFGISVGAEVECAAKLPAGPIVVHKGKQEIAIGRKLAESIEVKPA